MPLVLIVRDKVAVGDQEVKRIVVNLPWIVADALDTPGEVGGHLTRDDIEIVVRDKRFLDWNNFPLSIIIWANDFPARRINLDERRELIINRLKDCKPPNIHGFVWIMLSPASFGEF